MDKTPKSVTDMTPSELRANASSISATIERCLKVQEQFKLDRATAKRLLTEDPEKLNKIARKIHAMVQPNSDDTIGVPPFNVFWEEMVATLTDPEAKTKEDLFLTKIKEAFTPDPDDIVNRVLRDALDDNPSDVLMTTIEGAGESLSVMILVARFAGSEALKEHIEAFVSANGEATPFGSQEQAIKVLTAIIERLADSKSKIARALAGEEVEVRESITSDGLSDDALEDIRENHMAKKPVDISEGTIAKVTLSLEMEDGEVATIALNSDATTSTGEGCVHSNRPFITSGDPADKDFLIDLHETVGRLQRAAMELNENIKKEGDK